jgi:membrane-bound lytic murein transglycosylase B
MRLFKYKYMIALSASLVLLSIVPSLSNTTSKPENTNGIYFQTLQEMLIQDGFDEAAIRHLYDNPEVFFDVDGISLYFKHNESKLDYGQFATRYAIRRAKKYMKRHQSLFTRAEQMYGVDRQVITAIILVESQLGKLLGRKSILNTLSTMAALSDKKVRKLLWGKIASFSKVNRKEYREWTGRKSKWAYEELKAFLLYAKQERLNPAGVWGSYAGAMGIAQFMPSNALAFARDGDGDGAVDLFEHADAIASIGNYLRHYGWRPGINGEDAFEVIFQYNHSRYYVDTVLKIAQLLTDS